MRIAWKPRLRYLLDTQFDKRNGLILLAVGFSIAVLEGYDLAVAQIADDPTRWFRLRDLFSLLPWYGWTIIGLAALMVLLFEGGYRIHRRRRSEAEQEPFEHERRADVQVHVQFEQLRVISTGSSGETLPVRGMSVDGLEMWASEETIVTAVELVISGNPIPARSWTPSSVGEIHSGYEAEFDWPKWLGEGSRPYYVRVYARDHWWMSDSKQITLPWAPIQ